MLEKGMTMKYLKLTLISCTLVITSFAKAGIINDTDVTNDVIFGSGNANGFFTVAQDNGIEIGLRGKLRHNLMGSPENTFNSNGDGTYTFDAGVAPTQTPPTAVWSYEWSINSDYLESTGANLSDYIFELSIDKDPTAGVDFFTFNLFDGYFDHAIGTNATGNGDGSVAANLADFDSLIDSNNIAQNSWKPHWVLGAFGFDPTLDATYDISIAAWSRTQPSDLLVRNTIQIIAGNGATAVPEPSTLAIFMLALVGLASRRIKKH